MKKTIKTILSATALTLMAAGSALATPSTQIWIPSTDIQAFGTAHLGIDNYIRTSKDPNYGNTKTPNVYDLGLTFGLLPFEKVQLEAGIDYLVSGLASDSTPLYFNWKLGTPEESLFSFSPALAVGMYNMGTKTGATQQNIAYGLAAKTLPVVGRLSFGGYHGSETLLGKGQNDGVLASWDRTLSGLSDKVWVAVDYMSGNNANGAFSFGVSYAFAKNVSVIFGYDIYNNVNTGGKNTFTTQLDINFP